MTNKQAAIRIIKRLQANDHQALLAGGCVRDMLLDRRAKDFDVATSASPGEVIKLFKRTIKVGAKFGVVIVMLDDQLVEVATFRTETGYADGRHPESVSFSTAAEDARRRDFTINAIFYDPVNDKVLDFVSGRDDLKRRIIRTVGGPQQRFSEDYLRMLRAVRFSAQLEFDIDPESFSALCANAEKINRISGERIAMELQGIFASPNRSAGASMLIESGLAQAIFPQLPQDFCDTAIKVVGQLPEKIDFALALAAFFSGAETAFAIERLAALKLSRSQNRHIKFLLTNRGKLLDSQMPVSQLKLIAAEPYFNDLYELQRAIQKSSAAGLTALRALRKRINALGDIELKPKPLLNGHDLISLGAVPGPTMGLLTQEMYIAQLEGNIQTPEQAKKWCKKWLKEHKALDQ